MYIVIATSPHYWPRCEGSFDTKDSAIEKAETLVAAGDSVTVFGPRETIVWESC